MPWGSQVRGCVEAPLSAFHGVDKELQVPEWRSTQIRNWSDSWRKRRSSRGVTAGDSWRSEVRKWAWKQQRSGATLTQSDRYRSGGVWRTDSSCCRLTWNREAPATRGGGATVFIRTNNTHQQDGQGPCRWESAHGLWVRLVMWSLPPDFCSSLIGPSSPDHPLSQNSKTNNLNH